MPVLSQTKILIFLKKKNKIKLEQENPEVISIKAFISKNRHLKGVSTIRLFFLGNKALVVGPGGGRPGSTHILQ